MNWGDVYSAHDMNEKYNIFINKVSTMFENCFPLKVTQIKQKSITKPWITQGIKISCKTKRKMYLSAKNSSNADDSAKYKEYCKKLRKVIQASKQMYYEKKIAVSGNKIKTIWDIVKEETGRTRKEQEQIALRVDDALVTDGLSVANLFNKYFISVTDSMGLSGSVNNALEYLKLAFTNNFRYMNMSLTSPKEITSIIKSLKRKHSSGYDEISTN